MYEIRWSTNEEMTIMAEYWYKMAIEMAENDGIPKPNLQRVEEIKNLFMRESALGHLTFRVAIDRNHQIVACAGGLMRTEYPYPLAEEPSLFGWVISVYTLKEHRNHGLAYQLVDDICLWLKQKGAKRARLWSSSKGRKVYENLGFQQMMDMSKPLS